MDGRKFVEVQQYQARKGNLAKACQPGAWHVFGPTGFKRHQGPVHGFAEVAGVDVGLDSHRLADYMRLIDPELRPHVIEYVGSAKFLAVVRIQRVLDVRSKGWTWQDMPCLLQASPDAFMQYQGFPALGGSAMRSRLAPMTSEAESVVVFSCFT